MTVVVFGGVVRAQTQPVARASITVDAQKVENRISPMFYGQFMEFMYEDIKGGLYAELLRDRSFEEPANAIGLPRDWERDPDDRNDDTALKFHWDDSLLYPPSRSLEGQTLEHSVRITITQSDGQRRGIHQSGVPVREGVEYHGYLWVRSPEFEGHVTAALERDQTGGETYAVQDMPIVKGEWRKYEFTLKPRQSDPLAKLALLFYGRGRVWVARTPTSIARSAGWCAARAAVCDVPGRGDAVAPILPSDCASASRHASGVARRDGLRCPAAKHRRMRSATVGGSVSRPGAFGGGRIGQMG